MKVVVKGVSSEIHAEGNGQKDVFKELAVLQEVFGDEACGCCNSPYIQYRVREAQSKDKKKDFLYYEKVCTKCWAKLSFGQHNEGGTLFPKRKDDDGNPIGKRGWHQFRRDDDSSTSPANDNRYEPQPSSQAPSYGGRPTREQIARPYNAMVKAIGRESADEILKMEFRISDLAALGNLDAAGLSRLESIARDVQAGRLPPSQSTYGNSQEAL